MYNIFVNMSLEVGGTKMTELYLLYTFQNRLTIGIKISVACALEGFARGADAVPAAVHRGRFVTLSPTDLLSSAARVGTVAPHRPSSPFASHHNWNIITKCIENSDYRE